MSAFFNACVKRCYTSTTHNSAFVAKAIGAALELNSSKSKLSNNASPQEIITTEIEGKGHKTDVTIYRPAITALLRQEEYNQALQLLEKAIATETQIIATLSQHKRSSGDEIQRKFRIDHLNALVADFFQASRKRAPHETLVAALDLVQRYSNSNNNNNSSSSSNNTQKQSKSKVHSPSPTEWLVMQPQYLESVILSAGDRQLALDYWNELIRRNPTIEPTKKTFEYIIHATFLLKRFEQCYAAYKHMIKLYANPSIETLHRVTAALARIGQIDHAVRILTDMEQQPFPVMYQVNLYMDVMGESAYTHRVDIAESLWKKLWSNWFYTNVPPTKLSSMCNAMLHLAYNIGNPQLGFMVFQKMREHDVGFTANTFYHMIRLCQLELKQQIEVDDEENQSNDLSMMENSAYQQSRNQEAQERALEYADNLFRLAVDNVEHCRQKVFSAYISLLTYCKQYSQAAEVFDQLMEAGEVSGRESVNVLSSLLVGGILSGSQDVFRTFWDRALRSGCLHFVSSSELDTNDLVVRMGKVAVRAPNFTVYVMKLLIENGFKFTAVHYTRLLQKMSISVTLAASRDEAVVLSHVLFNLAKNSIGALRQQQQQQQQQQQTRQQKQKQKPSTVHSKPTLDAQSLSTASLGTTVFSLDEARNQPDIDEETQLDKLESICYAKYLLVLARIGDFNAFKDTISHACEDSIIITDHIAFAVDTLCRVLYSVSAYEYFWSFFVNYRKQISEDVIVQFFVMYIQLLRSRYYQLMRLQQRQGIRQIVHPQLQLKAKKSQSSLEAEYSHSASYEEIADDTLLVAKGGEDETQDDEDGPHIDQQHEAEAAYAQLRKMMQVGSRFFSTDAWNSKVLPALELLQQQDDDAMFYK